MYYEFYGMQEAPFSLNPDPRFLYLSDSHREALAQMTYALQTKAGFVVISGDIGTGKTTLIHSFFQQLGPEVRTAFLFHTILTAKGLLLNICREFGFAQADLSKTELLFALQDILLENYRQGNTALLVIDEAHHLKPEILEEIRMLSNLETAQRKLLQIMLFGQPELDVKLSQPELRQLRERIALCFRIKRLSREDTEQYINHRMHVAGCEMLGSLFTREAIDDIYAFSGGVPRMINKLCDRVLLMGYVKESRELSSDMVRRVRMEDSLFEAGAEDNLLAASPARAGENGRSTRFTIATAIDGAPERPAAAGVPQSIVPALGGVVQRSVVQPAKTATLAEDIEAALNFRAVPSVVGVDDEEMRNGQHHFPTGQEARAGSHAVESMAVGLQQTARINDKGQEDGSEVARFLRYIFADHLMLVKRPRAGTVLVLLALLFLIISASVAGVVLLLIRFHFLKV